MFKLSKLRLNAPSRANTSRPPRKTNVGMSVAFAVGALCASIYSAAAAPGPLVGTREGIVKGVIANGVAKFLGIPYAEPPLGNLRWKPSKKHAPWAGVLKTQAFGPTCAQISEDGVYAGPPNDNEDCLYLNVFTPDINPAGKEKLPVIIWFHGAGATSGEGSDYDGSKLASQGHTVVVTVNFRLGLFGYLAHPALDNEGHLFGNYQILDSQRAMHWTHENIAAFGGDPNNVTLAGQSGGAQNAVT